MIRSWGRLLPQAQLLERCLNESRATFAALHFSARRCWNGIGRNKYDAILVDAVGVEKSSSDCASSHIKILRSGAHVDLVNQYHALFHSKGCDLSFSQ